jgi:peroxiredoxin Q/BCP
MPGTPLEVGKHAPAFTLRNLHDEDVELADFRGRWLVLYFYPKDDTPGCTTEACEFTTGIRKFHDLEAAVVGVSPDTPERHREFIEKYALKVALLSDPRHETLERYEAWGEKQQYGKVSLGVKRSTVLIDPKGVVAFHWKNVKAAGHAEVVRAKLAELRG